jgi:predicted transcriptional regulator
VSAKTLRNSTSPYIGKYNITPELIKFLGQICTTVSSKLVKDGIIQKMTILSIKRDQAVIDKINFLIEITVFVAGNYYDITLMVKSS